MEFFEISLIFDGATSLGREKSNLLSNIHRFASHRIMNIIFYNIYIRYRVRLGLSNALESKRKYKELFKIE